MRRRCTNQTEMKQASKQIRKRSLILQKRSLSPMRRRCTNQTEMKQASKQIRKRSSILHKSSLTPMAYSCVLGDVAGA